MCGEVSRKGTVTRSQETWANKLNLLFNRFNSQAPHPPGSLFTHLQTSHLPAATFHCGGRDIRKTKAGKVTWGASKDSAFLLSVDSVHVRLQVQHHCHLLLLPVYQGRTSKNWCEKSHLLLNTSLTSDGTCHHSFL